MMQPELLHTEDGSPTLLNKALNATYHSRFGAIRESTHIYIDAGLNYAIQAFGNGLSILEIGFGTGLNALLTFHKALRQGLDIRYTTVEKYPVGAELAEKLDYPERIDPSLKRAFIKMHSCAWEQPERIAANFSLVKHHTDIRELVFPQQLHLVYYDAFAPSVCPEMWEPAIIERLSLAMDRHGCLVTFCAKGEIKRLLKAYNFRVEALPGPPGKREIVRAVKR